MRINTSGLYTTAFYKITDLDEGVECFSDLGEMKINYYAVNKECFAGDMDDQNKQIDRREKLRDEVNKKNILFQPTKFDAQIALKCHLIPFDVGNLKDCLVYNSLDHADNVNCYLNLDLYQALTDKSIDPNGHLAKNINWCKKFYAHYSTDTKYIFSTGKNSKKPHGKDILYGEDRLFVERFSKELLEEVYNTLITAKGVTSMSKDDLVLLNHILNQETFTRQNILDYQAGTDDKVMVEVSTFFEIDPKLKVKEQFDLTNLLHKSISNAVDNLTKGESK